MHDRYCTFLVNMQLNDYYCSLLDGLLQAEDSVTYGINHNSALNKIDYYPVANSQLPQDIANAYDFESVLNCETCLLILWLL